MKPDAVLAVLIAFAISSFLLFVISSSEEDREQAVCIDGMLMKSSGDYYVSLRRECVIKEQVAK